MILILQALLLVMVALINYCVIGVFDGAWWLAFVLTILGLGGAWFCYLVYQNKHPNWWAPWDEGLPQTSRMMNAFVPVFMIYIMVLIMLPVLQRAKQKGQRHQKQPVPATSISKSLSDKHQQHAL